MDEEKNLKQEVQEIKKLLIEGSQEKKKKFFKIPFKARVSKAKVKKGYVIVELINDNGSLDFVKEPIVDGTIKLGDTYHAVEDLDIFYYKGKPFIHQPKKKLTTYNPMTEQRPLDGSNQTYGQRYVMARMLNDEVKTKKSIGGWGILIFGLIIAAVVAYALIRG